MTQEDKVSDEYKATVEKMIKTGASTEIDNFSCAHADYLAEKMFSLTKDEALILTDGFFSPANGVKDAFTSMILKFSQNKHGKAKVIILGNEDHDIDWLIDLEAEHSSFLKVVPAVASNTDEVNHRFICDRKMYRFEDPHKPKAEEVHARVCFNNERLAGLLADGFTEVFDRLVTS